ncbi:hypothetical protein [Nocardioides sp.]|uniref:hypothetical protein n=1 Tax=Nocardioides sp. TaxID=35761 RepID=UPI002C618F34|nr:hypothetical protein [Nocardioides sp.]HSX65899.1 hypothetical protein [Nocardioides sp.]
MSTSTDTRGEGRHTRPTQGLVVRPDGLVEVTFLDLDCGMLIGGEFRGVDWRACLERSSALDNVPASTFARTLGWDGADNLRGIAVFFGGIDNPDLPGKVLAAAVRMWDVVLN